MATLEAIKCLEVLKNKNVFTQLVIRNIYFINYGSRSVA